MNCENGAAPLLADEHARGENVFREICGMFPEGDVFTHAYRPDRVPCLSSHAVRESFIAQLPFGRKWPQAYLPLMPAASRAFELDGYDLIVSMRLFRDFLRKEDLKSADAVDVFVANSHFVAERIRRIYGREAEVVGSGETNPR